MDRIKLTRPTSVTLLKNRSAAAMPFVRAVKVRKASALDTGTLASSVFLKSKADRLRTDVELTWNQLSIPACHRRHYLYKLSLLPALVACESMKLELYKLKRNQAPVLHVLKAIHKRGVARAACRGNAFGA